MGFWTLAAAAYLATIAGVLPIPWSSCQQTAKGMDPCCSTSSQLQLPTWPSSQVPFGVVDERKQLGSTCAPFGSRVQAIGVQGQNP